MPSQQVLRILAISQICLLVLCLCATLLANAAFADPPAADAPAAGSNSGSTAGSTSHIEAVPTAVAHPDPVPTAIIKAGEKLELQGEVQQNREVDKLNARLGFIAKTQGKDPFPARILSVIEGSPVAKRGIAPGDSLIGEVTNHDGSITLTMERGGQGMRFTLKSAELKAALAEGAPAKLDGKKDKLTAGISGGGRKQLKSIVDVLENHDLGLIIDCSGSMSTADCPGGLSRWEWCSREATGLAQAAAQAASSIDASLFNGQYQTFRHISPMQIPEIFAENRPMGGTEPAFALQEQLENFFNSSRAKPLTIVIVTDGLPNNPANIAQVLREESKKIRYQGELSITFLLIGERIDDQRMREMIGLAPGSSVKNGGFVDVLPFDWTASRGIKEALFEELKEVRLATNPHQASKASETAIGVPLNSNPYRPSGFGPPNSFGGRRNGMHQYGGQTGGYSGSGYSGSGTGYSGNGYTGGDSNGVVRQITSH